MARWILLNVCALITEKNKTREKSVQEKEQDQRFIRKSLNTLSEWGYNIHYAKCYRSYKRRENSQKASLIGQVQPWCKFREGKDEKDIQANTLTNNNS